MRLTPNFKRFEVLSGVDRGLPWCLSHVQIKHELTHRMYLNPIDILKKSSFDQRILSQFLWGAFLYMLSLLVMPFMEKYNVF